MPIVLNEPIGTLQKQCEMMANYELLEKAKTFETDSLKRTIYATIFTIV